MAVSYTHIAANERVPLFSAEFDNSQAATFSFQSAALLVGQKLAAGNAPADTPVLVSRIGDARTLFGAGSMLASMVDMFLRNNGQTQLWCGPLADNPAGAAASGSMTIAGTATATGTLNLYMGGQRVQVAVTVGDTAAEVATAIVAAMAELALLPVTGVAAAAVVTLTAKHKGEVGNDIDLRVNALGRLGNETTPAGLTVAVVAMTGGTSNPVLSGLIAGMGDQKFDAIICPYTDTTSLNAWETEMSDGTGRWSPSQEIYGHVYAAKRGTVAALQTFGRTRNDQHMSVMGYNHSISPTWLWATAFGAQAAKALAIDPARPLQTLKMTGLIPPSSGQQFMRSEQSTLLFSGISTWSEESGAVLIQRAITTYRVNRYGEPDNSYLDVNTLATLTRVIRRLKQRLTQKYSRHKLANDGTRLSSGQAIVTPNVLRAEIVAEYSQMVRLGLVENIEAFKAHLIVERNADDPNRVDVLYPPDLINQLRVLAVLGQFRLQYPTDLEAAV